MMTAGFPAYVGGDALAYADVEQRWAVCRYNDECPFEGWVQVEWQDSRLASFFCPECEREGFYELD